MQSSCLRELYRLLEGICKGTLGFHVEGLWVAVLGLEFWVLGFGSSWEARKYSL